MNQSTQNQRTHDREPGIANQLQRSLGTQGQAGPPPETPAQTIARLHCRISILEERLASAVGDQQNEWMKREDIAVHIHNLEAAAASDRNWLNLAREHFRIFPADLRNFFNALMGRHHEAVKCLDMLEAWLQLVGLFKPDVEEHETVRVIPVEQLKLLGQCTDVAIAYLGVAKRNITHEKISAPSIPLILKGLPEYIDRLKNLAVNPTPAQTDEVAPPVLYYCKQCGRHVAQEDLSWDADAPYRDTCGQITVGGRSYKVGALLHSDHHGCWSPVDVHIRQDIKDDAEKEQSEQSQQSERAGAIKEALDYLDNPAEHLAKHT